MKPRNVVCALFVLSAVFSHPLAAQASRIEGNWQGALKIQTFELRIVFHLQVTKEGSWKATMDSPDQGAAGIAIDSVYLNADRVRLVVGVARAEFEGKIEAGDSVVSGSWKQGGVTFPLTVRRTTAPVVVSRPQEPKPPFPYIEEEVSFPNNQVGIKLAGTLTLPKSGGPFAAAVLISGSGPQDRDENIFNHKPFKVIADYLTRNGIAVLRYDDRGKGGSTGDFGAATTVDFASDARAAVEYLQTRQDIDRKKIGLIGHSEGGLVAPMVADRYADIAFIILLAGPSLTGKEIILLQDSLISLANGVSIEKIRKNQDLGKKMYAIIESERDDAALKEKLKKFMWAAATEAKDSTVTKEQQEAGINMAVLQLSTPWFRHFLFYDPVPALKKVRCPMLALNGENDLQVPARVNLEGIKLVTKESGNVHVTVMMLPGLNHLFQHSKSGAPVEYARIEETFAPEALSTINNWIHSTLGLK